MPVATSTMTVSRSSSTAVIPLKAGPSPLPPPSSSPNPASSSTTATLRSLYNRAARAFLHRDVALTDSLISSAFALLHPPSFNPSDTLCSQRRKWDILRITLETTIYASPPATNIDSLPSNLRPILLLNPQSLMTSLYSRSLQLSTPTCATTPGKPDAAFLPSPILITLVLSSLKLDCPDVGKAMVEDWLSRRGCNDSTVGLDDIEGYEKVLDIYCLHVLARLQQWDFAREFLQYEGELPEERREHLKASLKASHSQFLASQRPPPALKSPSPLQPSPVNTSPRSFSPAPSTSSTSSSLSTISNHTVVPRTPRANSAHALTTLTAAASTSNVSLSSDSTITSPRHESSHRHSRNRSQRPGNGNGDARSSSSSVPRGSRVPHAAVVATRNPSTYTLLKATLRPYLTASKLFTFLLLFVVFPALSVMFRVRRRRLQEVGTATPLSSRGGVSTAEEVRRRLQKTADSGFVRRVWGELIKAVVDTVKMGGSGLI